MKRTAVGEAGDGHYEGFSGLARRALNAAPAVGRGFASQILSSATNLGLVILAARLGGADAVGIIAIGFWTYLLLLGFQRALITEPLIAKTSAGGSEMRADSARLALTLTFFASCAAALAVGGLAYFLPPPFDKGLLMFAPFLPTALMQDAGRSIVFRDRRRWTNTASDATWLLVMVAAIPIAVVVGSDFAVVATWGVGSMAGTVTVLIQLRWRPSKLTAALNWWRQDAARFGLWLAGQSAFYTGATYASVLALAGILGAYDYGGLRAIQSLFAPLSLLGPAIALPGLPLLSRLVRFSTAQAYAAASGLAAFTTIATAAYVAVLAASPALLEIVFGSTFVPFMDIVTPVGVSQILLAPTFAATLLLKAQQRGKALLWLGVFFAATRTASSVMLGSLYGISGAAWSGVFASGLYLLVVALTVIKSRRAGVVPAGASLDN